MSEARRSAIVNAPGSEFGVRGTPAPESFSRTRSRGWRARGAASSQDTSNLGDRGIHVVVHDDRVEAIGPRLLTRRSVEPALHVGRVGVTPLRDAAPLFLSRRSSQ